jgi:uncharacterized protein (DUF3820 family)
MMADSEENKSETFDYVSNWTVLFGKHKNTKFKDVPADYLRWCYERGVCDKNEKVAGYLEARFGD